MTTSKMLYFYCKFLGICPLDISENGCVRLSYGGLIYSTFLVVTYGFFFLLAAANQTNLVVPERTPVTVVANFVALIFDFGILMAAWLHFGLRPRQLQRIIDRYKSLNGAFQACGIRLDDETFLWEIKTHVTAVNVLWYSLHAYYGVVIHFIAPDNMLMWLTLTLPGIVSHNIVFIFVDVMKSCGRKFGKLNVKIASLCGEDSGHFLHRPKVRMDFGENVGLKLSASADPLEACGQIYSDLIDLTTSVVKFFSVTILFTMVFEFIQIALTAYTICLIVMDEKLTKWIFAWISWMGIHLGEMIVVVCVCESTVNEANNTGNVLHTMMNAKPMDKYEDSGKALSLRLLQRRLEIGIFGLFSLKHSIIHTIISASTVYVTIMMQLDSLNDSG